MQIPRKRLIWIDQFRIATILLLSTGLLASCGSSSDQQASPPKNNEVTVGTNGQLVSIQSDNVRAAGYEANSMTMTVEFMNGYTYEYYGVPTALWTSFIAAQPNPWSQVGYPQLVQAGVRYQRIR
jgi:hypothetical protein